MQEGTRWAPDPGTARRPAGRAVSVAPTVMHDRICSWLPRALLPMRLGLELHIAWGGAFKPDGGAVRGPGLREER